MFVKFECLEAVQGIPITAIVYGRNPLSWSQDNNIALATQLGLYINDVQVFPSGSHPALLLQKTFISPPANANPYIMKGRELLALMFNESVEVNQRVQLDADLSAAQRALVEAENRTVISPTASGGECNHCGFKRAVWSPRGMGAVNGCIILTLTYDSQVLIYGLDNRRWKLVCDVTPILHDFMTDTDNGCIKNIPGVCVGTEDCQKFIAKTKALSYREAVWGPLRTVQKETEGIVFIATANGHILILKIKTLITGHVTAEVHSTADIETLNISSLEWSQIKENEGYLTVGTSDGDVKLYYVKATTDDANVMFLGQMQDFNDSLSISETKLTTTEMKNEFILVIAKQNLLVVALLRLTHNTFKCVHFAHKFLSTLNITGMIVFPGCIYASCKDKHVKEIEYNVKRNIVTITKVKDVFTTQGISYLGFVASHNKAFCAVLEGVSVPFDHLQAREPSVISVFQVQTLPTLYEEVLSNEQCSLTELTDVFEAIRLYACKGTAPPLPSSDPQQVAALSPRLQRVLLWMLKISLAVKPNEPDLASLLSKTEECIVFDWILCLASKMQTQKSKASQIDDGLLASFGVMLKWMSSRKKDKHHKRVTDVKKFFRDVLQKRKYNADKNELCILCNSEVQREIFSIAVCKKGHSLPCCYLSLLPVVPLSKCCHCLCFYHTNVSNWFFNEIPAKCLICRRQLVTHSRSETNYKID